MFLILTKLRVAEAAMSCRRNGNGETAATGKAAAAMRGMRALIGGNGDVVETLVAARQEI